MQRLALFMLFACTTFDFLAAGDRFGHGGYLPRIALFAPEALGALALLLVIGLGTRNQFKYVRPAYWFVFAALLLDILCGIIVNHVGSGPIFAGLRLYMRAIPWFLLPAVFAFTEKQIRQQLFLLMGVCLVQVPVAIIQRIATSNPAQGYVAVTGDWTTGTIGEAGSLSIFLTAAACVIIALYQKKQLPLVRAVPLFLLVLIPTTINETKAMVVFLPVAIMAVVICASEPGVRMKRFVGGIVMLVMFGAIFVPVYDTLMQGREYGSTLGEFFSDKSNVTRYVSSTAGGAATSEEYGRGDAIVIPVSDLARDPVSLTFGYGLGNASQSSWGPNFSGVYADKYARLLQGAFSRFVLELGLLGVFFIYVLYWLIFQDARRIARSGNNLFAALGAAWTGVIALMCIAMFYSLVEVYPPLSYPFWYISGLIAAQRMRLAVDGKGAEPGEDPVVAKPSAVARDFKHGLPLRRDGSPRS